VRFHFLPRLYGTWEKQRDVVCARAVVFGGRVMQHCWRSASFWCCALNKYFKQDSGLICIYMCTRAQSRTPLSPDCPTASAAVWDIRDLNMCGAVAFLQLFSAPSLEFRLMQFWLCLRQTTCAALHAVNLIKKIIFLYRQLASGQRGFSVVLQSVTLSKYLKTCQQKISRNAHKNPNLFVATLFLIRFDTVV
jgi:hypothetical protein